MSDIPAGTIMAFGGAGVPPCFLACDGSAVSRAAYTMLFSAIGTTWGAGDGSTTFNVPDLRDRTPIGVSPGSLPGNRPTARTLGQTGGEESHTLTTPEMPAHVHGLTDPGHSHGYNNPNDAQPGSGFLDQSPNIVAGAVDDPSDFNTTGISIGSTGGGGAHNNMQPFGVAQWIIKT